MEKKSSLNVKDKEFVLAVTASVDLMLQLFKLAKDAREEDKRLR